MEKPRLFDYSSPKSDPHEVVVKEISGYLVDGPNVLVGRRMRPLSSEIPESSYGSKPVDGGNLIVEPSDHDEALNDSVTAKYLRPYKGASELVHGTARWGFG